MHLFLVSATHTCHVYSGSCRPHHVFLRDNSLEALGSIAAQSDVGLSKLGVMQFEHISDITAFGGKSNVV